MNKIKPGQVYVQKNRGDFASYAVVILKSVAGEVIVMDTSSTNEVNNLKGYVLSKPENFLKEHELARPGQLERIITEFDDAKRAIGGKLDLLRAYVAAKAVQPDY